MDAKDWMREAFARRDLRIKPKTKPKKHLFNFCDNRLTDFAIRRSVGGRLPSRPLAITFAFADVADKSSRRTQPATVLGHLLRKHPGKTQGTTGALQWSLTERAEE
jgi:hypothetical protein